MAVSFKPIRKEKGEYILKFQKLAASQTIAEGDPVVLNSSQLVELATTSSTALYGFAAQSANSTDDTYIGIWVASDDTVFKATASGTVSLSNFNTGYDLAGSTGNFTVNIAASTTGVLEIVDIPDGIERGTFETEVYVKVPRAKSQYEV